MTFSDQSIEQDTPDPTRVKLAGVKHGLYNPFLASLKQIEKDVAHGKLSSDAARTTLPPGISGIPKELFYQYNPSSHYVPGYDVLPLSHMKIKEDETAASLSFLNNPDLSKEWTEFKKQLPLPVNRIVQIPSVRHFHFLNYQVRYQKPEVREAWREKMNQFDFSKYPKETIPKE